MEFIIYIFLLFMNMNLFIKLLITFFSFLFIIFIIFICYKYYILKKYLREIKIFKKEFNNKNINLIKFYNKLLIKKINIIGLSSIFFLGFEEFIYLHRNGVYNIIIICKIMNKIMKISMFKEINVLTKYLYFFSIIKVVNMYLGLFGSIVGFVLFIKNLNFNIHKSLLNFMFMSNLTEIMLPISVSFFIIFLMILFRIMYTNVLRKIFYEYKLFINEFIILLYHKSIQLS